MREIKVRIWDHINKKMLYDFSKDRYDLLSHSGGRLEAVLYQADGANTLTILEWTSLKDKNGKLIWEGDIVVREGYPWFDNFKSNYRDTVEWLFAGFHTVHRLVNLEKRGISDGIHEPLEDNDVWEVLGNIYENPELLPGKIQEAP